MKTAPCPSMAMLVFWLALPFSNVSADLVTVSTTTATGISHVVSSNDFVGVLTNVGPPTIGSTTLNFPNVPSGSSFLFGDIVGRDVDATLGSTQWVYELILPSDAILGTGFEQIQFSGRAFERANNNLEAGDALRWDLFFNNDLTPAASTGPTPGSDWTTFAISLNHTGGAGVQRVRAVMTISGFTDNGEWFAANGTLQAVYHAIPESVGLLFHSGVFGCLLFFRCRRRMQIERRSRQRRR